jgi:hypothetical protein
MTAKISYEIFTDKACTFGKRIAYQQVESIPSTFGDIKRNAGAFAERVKAGQLLPVRPDWSTEQLRNAVPVAPGEESDADAVYHIVPVYLRMKVTNGSSRDGATSASSDLDELFGALPAATNTDDLGF